MQLEDVINNALYWFHGNRSKKKIKYLCDSIHWLNELNSTKKSKYSKHSNIFGCIFDEFISDFVIKHESLTNYASTTHVTYLRNQMLCTELCTSTEIPTTTKNMVVHQNVCIENKYYRYDNRYVHLFIHL